MPVTINGKIELDFTVDSGASTVVVPADVFGTLIRTGTIADADLMGKQNFTLADGSTQMQDTFRIRSLKIGDRVLHDVGSKCCPGRRGAFCSDRASCAVLGRGRWSISAACLC